MDQARKTPFPQNYSRKNNFKSLSWETNGINMIEIYLRFADDIVIMSSDPKELNLTKTKVVSST